jgi:hypothetical protein
VENDKELQIGCYLSRREARQLSDYARSVRLRRPSLCILLVQNELLCPRLELGVGKYHGSLPKKGSARVTTRVDAELKDAFHGHAEKHGLGSDDAAAVIFLRELDQHWLKHALGGESPLIPAAS